jgi:transcriptional regulator with GAF, ATPase, and Fis domain
VALGIAKRAYRDDRRRGALPFLSGCAAKADEKRVFPLLVAERKVELGRLEIQCEIVAGKPGDQTHVLEGDVCRIGSHPSNDLVLDDPTISRFHCRLARENGVWRVLDTESRNGTRVAGVKVLSAELEGPAVLSLGNSQLRVRPGATGASASVPTVSSFGAILGESVAMRRFFGVLDRIAASGIDVLILGENGTGKELVATELVQRSSRADGPLVVVDCGSISPSLVESELFGHVRGAFTGADRDREGAFEAADGGTVFLDEIGELPPELQPKLLRALEQREVRRVGQTKSMRVDVRVIAATNRDLEREVNRGRFREDLYYRLAKVSVRVPALRERLEDIPLLVRAFLVALGREDGSRLFSPSVLAEMQGYDWPGNVRELRNYVERAVVLEDVGPPSRRSSSGMMAAVAAPSPGEGAPSPKVETPAVPFRVAKEAAVTAFERTFLAQLLERCDGNVSKAARFARMDRMYLHQLVQKHGLRESKKE